MDLDLRPADFDPREFWVVTDSGEYRLLAVAPASGGEITLRAEITGSEIQTIERVDVRLSGSATHAVDPIWWNSRIVGNGCVVTLTLSAGI